MLSRLPKLGGVGKGPYRPPPLLFQSVTLWSRTDERRSRGKRCDAFLRK